MAFDPGQVRAINIGYDTARRANQVSDGAVQATYTRAGNAPAVGQVVLKVSGTDRLTANYSHNGARQMVTNVAWSADGTNVASFGYGLAINAPRIARLSMPDGTRWDYAYDAIGQLVGATQRLASGAVVAGRTFAYTNDTIGNAVRAGPVEGGEPLYRFTVTNDNFHVRRVWSNLVEVTGTAQTNAAVSVFLKPYGPIVAAARQGERFRALLAVSNAASAIWQPIQVIAVRQEGTNDFVQLTDGSFYLPKADETVVRAEGAYVLVDSRWAYTWDWGGKLVAIVSSNRAQNLRLAFDYYPDGRRARKIVSVWTNGAWQAVQTNRFCYDRWNPIEEEIRTSNAMVTNRYTWGLDLAGRWSGQYEQEAGGIGGLLAVTVASGGVERVYLPIADAKGNIRHLWDVSSNKVAATYDYDPFGRLIGESGPAVDACPFRFSTKYLDEETGLYYYGYRYYDPCSLKWLSRDPLGESGGLNLTAFCRNDPVNSVDPLGLEPVLCYDPTTGKAGYFDTYDIHYLGWNPAVNQGETVPRFDSTIPLGDRPYDILRGESVRMQFGEGMATAVSALPETAFILGQSGKIVVGAAIAAGDPSGLVKAFGAGLVLDGLDELKGYSCGTDTYFVQGLKGLGLDERDIARAQFVKGAGQGLVLLAYSIPAVQQAHISAYPARVVNGGNVLRYHYAPRATIEEILCSGELKALDVTLPEGGVAKAWVTRITPAQMTGRLAWWHRTRLGFSPSTALRTPHFRSGGIVFQVEDAFIEVQLPESILVRPPFWRAPFGGQEYIRGDLPILPTTRTGGI